jgi:hypothetical protein
MNQRLRLLAIVLVAAAVMSARTAIADPIDRRTTLGAAKTQVVSAIVSALYPQAQIAWLDRREARW